MEYMEMIRKDYRVVLEAWNKFNGGGPLTESQIKFLDETFTLPLWKWYWMDKGMKDRGAMLFFCDKDIKTNSIFTGFNLDGAYTDKLHVEYTGNEVLATREEVEEMFKAEFIRRGYGGYFKSNYKCLCSPSSTVCGRPLKFEFTLNNKLWVSYRRGSNLVFDYGVWSDINK